jgi:hypothetical protein
MAIRLDHTIVPAKDKMVSAEFFAQVQVNESLTLDFADAPEPWGGPGFDPRVGPTVAGQTATPTAGSTLAGAGAASTSRTLTATCWRS